MNGRYHLAESPEERLSIAVVAAIHRYFVDHPSGVAPGQHFLMDFLKPFVDRELSQARLDEAKRSHSTNVTREVELNETIRALSAQCDKKVGASDSPLR